MDLLLSEVDQKLINWLIDWLIKYDKHKTTIVYYSTETIETKQMVHKTGLSLLYAGLASN